MPAQNSKLPSRPSGKLLMRVFHLLRRRLALNKRLTNSLADQVIRVWVLAHRRLLVKNSRSLSRPSGKLSMRVFHLLRRRLVLNKRSTNSLGEPLTPVLLLALVVSFPLVSPAPL